MAKRKGGNGLKIFLVVALVVILLGTSIFFITQQTAFDFGGFPVEKSLMWGEHNLSIHSSHVFGSEMVRQETSSRKYYSNINADVLDNGYLSFSVGSSSTYTNLVWGFPNGVCMSLVDVDSSLVDELIFHGSVTLATGHKHSSGYEACMNFYLGDYLLASKCAKPVCPESGYSCPGYFKLTNPRLVFTDDFVYVFEGLDNQLAAVETEGLNFDESLVFCFNAGFYQMSSYSSNVQVSFKDFEVDYKPFCGDDSCDSDENCTSCNDDCGDCSIPPDCSVSVDCDDDTSCTVDKCSDDGVCEYDDSSCDIPPGPEPANNYLWVIGLILAVVLVGVIIYFVFRNNHKKRRR